MVAITVVLAAVLYVMVIGFNPTVVDSPKVGFIGPRKENATAWSVSVAGVDRSAPLSSFKIVLTNGTSVVCASSVLAATDPVCGSGAIQVAFVDLDGGGTLTGGDKFVIRGTHEDAVGRAYELSLLWAQGGSRVQSTSFP